MPTKARIEIPGCVKAFHFLHGCGWSSHRVPFADYIIHFKKGSSLTIPLIPLGRSLQKAHRNLAGLKPNLQDWWPDLEQRDFHHAMHVTIFNHSDPLEYQRYLYTLEWINPQPRAEVSHIEARVDPKAGRPWRSFP